MYFLESTEIIWIIGGGQFGLRAANQLISAQPGSAITLVDREPVGDGAGNIDIVTDDGISWLLKHFTPSAQISKIIPAVPLHLAAYWLQGKLLSEQTPVRLQTMADWLVRQFPNPFQTADKSVVMSYADFICPSDCPEPDEFCTHTGLPRPPPLYQSLETMDCRSYQKLILQSRQFAPGVGGFYPDDLWYALEQARQFSGNPILTATACKCHGVASLLYPIDFNPE